LKYLELAVDLAAAKIYVDFSSNKKRGFWKVDRDFI
jgi:hypothetical protein